MEIYDYNEAVRDDVRSYIENNVDLNAWTGRREELEEELNDKLFIDDEVTGNGSGSYWCNAWKAEECLAHNWDVLADALDEFGSGSDVLRMGAEACDVTIRCYLLGSAISEILDEYEEDGAFDEPDETEPDETDETAA